VFHNTTPDLKIKAKTTVCKTKTDFLVSDRSFPKTDGLGPHHCLLEVETLPPWSRRWLSEGPARHRRGSTSELRSTPRLRIAFRRVPSRRRPPRGRRRTGTTAPAAIRCSRSSTIRTRTRATPAARTPPPRTGCRRRPPDTVRGRSRQTTSTRTDTADDDDDNTTTLRRRMTSASSRPYDTQAISQSASLEGHSVERIYLRPRLISPI